MYGLKSRSKVKDEFDASNAKKLLTFRCRKGEYGAVNLLLDFERSSYGCALRNLCT